MELVAAQVATILWHGRSHADPRKLQVVEEFLDLFIYLFTLCIFSNDSQHSNQSHASLSLSLPPPTGSVSSHSSGTTVNTNTQEASSIFLQQQQQHQQQPTQQQLQHQQHNNGGLLVTAAGVTPNTNAAGDVNNHRLSASGGAPAVVGNKENANPVDFVLRRPRNCALLNVSCTMNLLQSAMLIIYCCVLRHTSQHTNWPTIISIDIRTLNHATSDVPQLLIWPISQMCRAKSVAGSYITYVRKWRIW